MGLKALDQGMGSPYTENVLCHVSQLAMYIYIFLKGAISAIEKRHRKVVRLIDVIVD